MVGTLEVGQIEALIMAAALCLPRLMVVMFIVPMFDASTVPRTVRIAIALGMGLPAIYGVFDGMPEHLAPLLITVLVAKEVFLGLVLGVALAAPFWCISGVGVLLDNQRGANSGSQVTPMGKADESVIGIGLQQALVVMLSTSGGLVAFYQMLLGSFEAWPVLSLTPDLSGIGADAMFMRFTEFVKLALLYAGPILGVLILIDFAFALMGLAAPSLPSYFAAMPVKSIVGVFVVAVYLWTLLDVHQQFFRKAIEFDSAVVNQATTRK